MQKSFDVIPIIVIISVELTNVKLPEQFVRDKTVQ